MKHLCLQISHEERKINNRQQQWDSDSVKVEGFTSHALERGAEEDARGTQASLENPPRATDLILRCHSDKHLIVIYLMDSNPARQAPKGRSVHTQLRDQNIVGKSPRDTVRYPSIPSPSKPVSFPCFPSFFRCFVHLLHFR